jgi:regulator of sirC expression with transglutaminase-like and TPR domain
MQIKLKPDVLAYINRGNVYRDTEQLERPRRSMARRRKLAPTDARGWRNRGMIRLYQGDTKRGIADYDKALQYDPADAYSWNNRGHAKMRLGDKAGGDCGFPQSPGDQIRPAHRARRPAAASAQLQ